MESRRLISNFNIPDYPIVEVILLYALFFTIVFVCYFLPTPFRYLLIAIVLLFYAFSKKDYWWLALFFIIYSSPWNLLKEGTRDSIVGMPLLSFGSGISFSFVQLFFLIALFKAFYKNRPFQIFLKKEFILIFFYFSYLIIQSFFLGTSLEIVFEDLRFAIFWAFIFVFPALIHNRKDTYKFIFLIVPIVILVTIDALYFLFSGGLNIYEYFNPDSTMRVLLIDREITNEKILRFTLPGWHGILIGFIFSLALMQIDKKHLFFLRLIVGMSFLSLIIAATRSWFIIFIIILGYTILKGNKNINSYLTAGILTLLFVILIASSPLSSNMFGAATKRIFTVFNITEKKSASNQAIENKIEYRLPKQILLFKQNPITGWGFTRNKGDMDIGFFGFIVEVGIIGTLIFFRLWYKYLVKLNTVIKNPSFTKENRSVLRVLWIGLIGILISHFTTNQIFGITYYTVVIPMFFWLSDFFLKECLASRTNVSS